MAASVDCTIRYTFPQARAKVVGCLMRSYTNVELARLLLPFILASPDVRGIEDVSIDGTNRQLAWRLVYMLLPQGNEARRPRRPRRPAAVAPSAPSAGLLYSEANRLAYRLLDMRIAITLADGYSVSDSVRWHRLYNVWERCQRRIARRFDVLTAETGRVIAESKARNGN